MRLEALREAPYAFGSRYELEVGRDEKDWRLGLTTRTRFVAEVAGEVAGTVSGGEAPGARTAAITSMWVDPRFRRQGVGERLVQTVIEWARAAGYASVALCVREGNTAAERLYLRCGFARTGALCDDRDHIEYEMARRL